MLEFESVAIVLGICVAFKPPTLVSHLEHLNEEGFLFRRFGFATITLHCKFMISKTSTALSSTYLYMTRLTIAAGKAGFVSLSLKS